MATHVHTGTPTQGGGPAGSTDDGHALLAEVDFKWLMAGQGWWIDVARLRSDPLYASKFLRLALDSPSDALRECAIALQARLGSPVRFSAKPGCLPPVVPPAPGM